VKIRASLIIFRSETTVHLPLFLSLVVKDHVHSVTLGQLRKPQHTTVRHKHQACHLEIALLSSFGPRVIQGHSYWCKQKQDLVLSYKRHNNVDLISETYKDITLGKLQIRRFNHSTPVWWQFSKKRLRISTSNLCYQKLESLSNILSLIMWMYLHSIFCGEIRKTHLFCNCVLICCSRSSKVDDFGINWKRIRDFLL